MKRRYKLHGNSAFTMRSFQTGLRQVLVPSIFELSKVSEGFDNFRQVFQNSDKEKTQTKKKTKTNTKTHKTTNHQKQHFFGTIFQIRRTKKTKQHKNNKHHKNTTHLRPYLVSFWIMLPFFVFFVFCFCLVCLCVCVFFLCVCVC